MLFDPFINGVVEMHDRHREMRLDVDNMSYEVKQSTSPSFDTSLKLSVS
jgi:hypothetical protein